MVAWGTSGEEPLLLCTGLRIGGQTMAATPKRTADGIPVYCAFDELADIGSLKPHPRNPNRHPESQIALLAKIIKAQGWRAPITVSNRSGYIVRGHGRLLAAQLLGVKQVPVDRQDYASDEEELADLIADNRIAELAEMDSTMLKDVLEELDTGAFDMELTGFTEDALEDLMTQFHVEDEDDMADDFDVAKALAEIAKPRISEGEVWTLGRHKLMCGDSTKRDTWERLFGGQKADLIVTSPPYNTGIKYASYKDKRAKDDYLGMIAAVGELMFQYLRPGRYVAWNVGVFPDSYPHYHVVVLEGCGFKFYRQIVWEKAGVPYPIFPSTLKTRRARHYKPNYKHEVISLYDAIRSFLQSGRQRGKLVTSLLLRILEVYADSIPRLLHDAAETVHLGRDIKRHVLLARPLLPKLIR